MSLPWPNWTEQQWRDAPTGETTDITVKYDPNQPREPAGTSIGGQFASTGLGVAAAESTRLQGEAKIGIAALEKLLPEAIADADYGASEDDDTEGKEWDDLDSETQQAAYYKYYESAIEDGVDVDTSGIEADLERDLRRDNEGVIEATQEALLRDFEKRFPHHAPTLPMDDPATPEDEGFSLYRTLDPETLVVGDDRGDGAPLIETDNLAFIDGTLLSPAERDMVMEAWDNFYRHRMEDALFDARESDSFMEQRDELEREAIQEQWNNLDDDEKFSYATGNLDSVRMHRKKLTPGEPTEWILGTEEGRGGEDALRTKAISRELTLLRTEQLLTERGIPHSRGLVSQQARETWSAWKDSSQNNPSLQFQLAATEELGGVHRISKDRVAELMENMYGDEFKLMKAYARAQWETTQYVFHKAGEDTVDVYRGLMLPGAQVNATRVEKVSGSVSTNDKLPDLSLQRAGLQSTTTDLSVANSWHGVGDLPDNPIRVVLRMRVPATSVISIPVFGQNVHEEREVVVVGMKEKWEWDAWKTKAPAIQLTPFKKSEPASSKPATPTYTDIRQVPNPEKAWPPEAIIEEPIAVKAEKRLVIDLHAHNAGPHWLSDPTNRLRAIQERRRQKVPRG